MGAVSRASTKSSGAGALGAAGCDDLGAPCLHHLPCSHSRLVLALCSPKAHTETPQGSGGCGVCYRGATCSCHLGASAAPGRYARYKCGLLREPVVLEALRLLFCAPLVALPLWDSVSSGAVTMALTGGVTWSCSCPGDLLGHVG